MSNVQPPSLTFKANLQASSLLPTAMPPTPFAIREHTFEGQHIREYPRALATSPEAVVLLHAKSYTPLEVSSGSVPGDLTIIAFHANAFPKEVYEPFFEALYLSLKRDYDLVISSIWIADQAAQGASALLNDEKLGLDPSWFDHSRDVLAMTNAFRSHMKRPLVAIGHSMGGTQGMATAHLHPSLFTAVVMIDAPLTRAFAPSMKNMLHLGLARPESYASRVEAEVAVRKDAVFRGWDPRCVQRYIETAFHDSPTVAIPDADVVKPTTSKFAEVATLVRANLEHRGVSPEDVLSDLERAELPNIDPDAPLTAPVYNPHARLAWTWLPSLRPSTLYLLGKGSRVCRQDELEERTNITGTAPGGSGGAAAGKVASITLPGGHFLPMTNPTGTAGETAKWLRGEISRFRDTDEQLAGSWKRKSLAEKQRLEPEVVEVLKAWDGNPWAKPDGKAKGEKSRL